MKEEIEKGGRKGRGKRGEKWEQEMRIIEDKAGEERGGNPKEQQKGKQSTKWVEMPERSDPRNKKGEKRKV